MSKDLEIKHHQDLDDEALAIIVRRRPDLMGKTLEQARSILRAEFPGKKVRDQKTSNGHR